MMLFEFLATSLNHKVVMCFKIYVKFVIIGSNLPLYVMFHVIYVFYKGLYFYVKIMFVCLYVCILMIW